MNNVQVRLPLGLGHLLQTVVRTPGAHEYVAFCLASHVVVGNTHVLLVRNVLTLPEGSYAHDGSHGAAWRGEATIPIIEAAMRQDLGVILVHAHPFGRRPALSRDDIEGAGRLLPVFQARVPGRPHASIVLGPIAAAGVIALPGDPVARANVGICWMGSATIAWPASDLQHAVSADKCFDRQGLVVGDQERLGRATVTVVGAGGGGSHVVQQLAHAGVGTVIGIDRDACDLPNLHRTVGMRRGDGTARTSKLDVMRRLVRGIGSGTKFIGVEARVPEPAALAAMGQADVIVGCVDNLHARADIQEVAWRRIIPYVDIGVSIRALDGSPSDPRVTVGGNVHVLIPGGFCLWCCGFLTQGKLDAETGGKPRSYFENRGGQAQVVSFNGVVASQAVTEVIQLLTGFRGASINPYDLALDDGRQRGALKLDGLRGSVEDWGGERRAECPSCAVLGGGTVLWRAAS